MSIKKDFFAPLSKGLGATRRAAMTLLVMLLTATTAAWATTTSTINVGSTDYTLFTGFTATAGTAGTFGYANFVDGNTSTKWWVMKKLGESANDFAGGTEDPAYVEFHADAPFIPKGYILTYDNSANESWKPTSWALKAKLNESDNWTTIHSSNSSLGNGSRFEIACNNDGDNIYQYFRFEIYDVGSSYQSILSELEFYGNKGFIHLTPKVATCTETGIKQECWYSNGKYFSDANGTTELDESAIVEPMKAHTCVHHEASATNTEYWQCSVCGKYFSDSGCTNEISEAEALIGVFGAIADGRYTLTSQTYTLTDDVNTAGYIYVPEGVTATIDLNGHTIDRGLTSAMTNGSVIIVEGMLTITDSSTGGKVQGGYDAGDGYGYYTSCVKVLEGATFNLQGGTLIGRVQDYDYTVSVVENSYFTMTGGKITGGWTGVLAVGNVTLTGGEISGNSNSGVRVVENFSISGNPVITGNTVMNADLRSSGGIRKINITGALTDGANIGITAPKPTDNAPVTVTSGYGTYNSEPVSTYFSLDNGGKIQTSPFDYMTVVMGWNEDRTEVAVGTALYTVNFDMNGHGTDIDAVSLLSGYKVAEPTAPTADGWYFVGWFTDDACTSQWNFNNAVTSNMTLHALWTQEAIYSFTLPENMVIVSTTNAPVGGKYPVGTEIKFKVSSADYVVDGDVSDGTNTLTPDGDGIYTVTVGEADITITATVKKAVEANKELSGSESYTAQNGDVLTGTTSGTVTIADNADITLSDVTITGGIVCAGTATITLVGTNSVSGATNKAGIQVGGSGTTLTIKGNGSLTANGGDQSAGIGLSRAWLPGNDVIGGNIVIEGGNITANGGSQWGAGIGTGVIFAGGGALTARIGNITIKGGTVKATGGSDSDGIGTGYTYSGCTNAIGTVTIYDGIDKVDASSIKNSGSIVYKHEENDVTASTSDYFTIIENGDRRVITPKDDTDYTITILGGIEHGTLTGAATAKYGEKVTITATPDSGYRLTSLVVKDVDNNDVATTGNSFFMPKSNVTVSAVFEQGTHGTTEFDWGLKGDYYNPFTKEATIYDGVTTVELQQGQSYQILKYDNEYSHRNFLLDNDTYNVTIPYSGGTGTFPEYGNGTNFRVDYNSESGFYDITMTDVGNGKWSVSILKTVGVIDNIPDQPYTISEITPEPLVLAGSLSLTKGTDYEYSYTDNTNVGTAKVTVTFKDTYASLGSVEKEFTIVPKSMTNNDITVTIPSQEWTGSAIEPAVTVKDGETTLTPGTDYEVAYSNNVNAGTATVTITGKGNYAGEITATFNIDKATTTVTAPIANTLIYDGSEQELVTAGSTDFGTLLYSLDGETYSEGIPTATNAGTYTVYYKVVADANHKDVAAATVKVTIARKAATVTAEDKTKEYGAADPELTATVAGAIGEDKIAYTLTRAEGENAGEYAITASGEAEQGNYSVTYAGAKFTITAANGAVTAPTAITGLEYNGKAQNLIAAGSSATGTIQYSLDGNTYAESIPQGTDAKEYTVYYKVAADANHKDVAAATVKVTIARKAATVTAEDKTKEYGAADPELTATVAGLIGEDKIAYTLARAEGEDAGEYAITASGEATQGNYSVTYAGAKFTITAKPEPEKPEPNAEVVNPDETVTVGGETFYEPKEETKEALKEHFDTDLALSAEAANSMTVNSNGEMEFKQGKNVDVAIANKQQGDVMKFEFTGKMFGDSSKLRQKGVASTRSAGDMELISGAEYEVLETGSIVITVAALEAPVTFKGISTTAAGATGIEAVNKEQQAADSWYDLNGRRLQSKPTQKGIYIRNGQKIVIK